MMIKAAKRIFYSDKICRSYSDLIFGVTFLEHGASSFIACFGGGFCMHIRQMATVQNTADAAVSKRLTLLRTTYYVPLMCLLTLYVIENLYSPSKHGRQQ